MSIEVDDPLNLHFGETGYDYSDFILNMGCSFLWVVGMPILILTLALFSYCCCVLKCKSCCRRRLDSTLFNGVTAFIDAETLTISVSACIYLKKIQNGAIAEKTFSYYAAITFLTLIGL